MSEPDNLPPRDPKTGQFEPRTPPAVTDLPEPKSSPKPAPAEPPKPDAPDAPPAPPKVGPNLLKLASGFLGRTEKKTDPKSDGVVAPEEPEAPAEPAVPAKPKVAKPKPAAPPPPPAKPRPAPVQPAEDLADKIAEGVARGLKAKSSEGPAQPAEQEPELDAAEQKKLKVYERLEKMQPERYQGLAQKHRDFLKKASVYADQWEKDNPGETFNPSDAIHNDFYDANQPDVDADDVVEAKADLLLDQRLSSDPRIKKMEEQTQAAEMAKKVDAAKPKIVEGQIAGAKEYWKLLGPEFADIVRDGPDGKPVFNREKLDQLLKADPEFNGYRLNLANNLHIEAEEIYKLMNGLSESVSDPKGPAFNPDNPLYPVHVVINNFGYECEREILEYKPEDRLDEHGRTFAPVSKYWSMPEEQRQNFWTLTADVLIAKRAKKLAKTATEYVEKEEERFRRIAAARGVTLPARQQNGAPAHPDEPAAALDEHEEKPESIALPSPSKLAAAKSHLSTPGQSGRTAFVLRGFGSR